MRPPKNKWPNTDGSRGILLFGQLMAEMLNPATFESFRVRTLSTISRLDEALTIIDDVQRDRLPRQSLDPIISEALWSLDCDPVARHIAHSEIESLRQTAKGNPYTLFDLSAHITLIRKLIYSDYKRNIEAKLLDEFNNDRAQISFREASQIYCSHLVNLGYSKPHIARLVDKDFFTSDIQRVGIKSLKRFFRRFKETPTKFIVYTAVSRHFGQFLQKLGFSVVPEQKLPSVAAGHMTSKQNPTLSLVLLTKREAFDEYSAMISVEELLASVRALTYLDPHGIDCGWSERMFVMRLRSKSGLLQERLPITFNKPFGSRPPAGRRGKGLINYAERIINSFDLASTDRLLGSINTGAFARTSQNPENQLISLWSAVEVLLSEPSRDIPRIVHYIKLLLPCICLRHIRRKFVAVSDELLVLYCRKFKDVINNSTQQWPTDFHTKFACAMLLAEDERRRKELLQLCTNNPLALQRLFSLHNGYKKPKAIAVSIEDHEKRVEWQLYRIYRARNHIVHAGRVASYLNSLIMNLFEYFRGAVATIVNHARREQHMSDIDQVVAEIGIEYGIFKRYFQTHSREVDLSLEALKRLVA